MLAIPHSPPPMSVNGIVAQLLTRMYHTHLIPAASRLLNVAPPHSQAALQTTPDITTVRLEVKCAAITLVLHKLVYGHRSSFLCYQGCYAACCLQSWLYVSAPYGKDSREQSSSIQGRYAVAHCVSLMYCYHA